MFSELGCTFHHLGLACRDLDAEARPWMALGYTAEAPDFHDPIQQVRGRFLVGPGPRLELLIPSAAGSPVEGVLQRHGKIYHQAFLTPKLEETIAAARAARCKLVVEPVPAVAFDGRLIAFLLMPNMNLLELIDNVHK